MWGGWSKKVMDVAPVPKGEGPGAPVTDEDQLAWLALTLTPGLGPRRILDAVKQLESASQIFTMPSDGA